VIRLLLDLSSCEPAFGLALDEVLFESARLAGVSTLRAWVNDRAVVVGRSQSAAAEVDLERARALRVPVVRRISGGGTVVHYPGNLNLSLAVSDSRTLGGVEEAFARVGAVLVLGLGALGVAAEVDGNAILVVGRKVAGAAQARRSGAILYHTTLLVSRDREGLGDLLLAPRPGYRPSAVPSHPRPTTTLADAAGRRLRLRAVAKRLAPRLAAVLGEQPVRGRLTRDEVERARDVARMKYGSPEWNLSR